MTEIQQTKPALRPETAKELSPRDRAEARAKELLESGSDVFEDGTDELFVDKSQIPDGWSYEWKSREVLGKVDSAYQVLLARKGWECVPASRHPEMMPVGYTGNDITRKGLVLMERPQSITNEAREIEARRAGMQVRTKEEQLSAAPPGQFERTNKGNRMTNIKKGFEAISIPQE